MTNRFELSESVQIKTDVWNTIEIDQSSSRKKNKKLFVFVWKVQVEINGAVQMVSVYTITFLILLMDIF